jgi:hypothetical protein
MLMKDNFIPPFDDIGVDFREPREHLTEEELGAMVAMETRPETQGRRWRRTGLTRPDGYPAPDDWSLFDEKLGPVARLYRTAGGPQDGRWFWAVQIDAEGHPYNSGTGSCATGGEARQEIERILFTLYYRREKTKLYRGEPSALRELEVRLITPEDFERYDQRLKDRGKR